ncbi:hypothetical protein [Bacillus phage FI_KG-Lek]|nr:hypothetical protein [Bacillus phage FI_KG-Lek]
MQQGQYTVPASSIIFLTNLITSFPCLLKVCLSHCSSANFNLVSFFKRILYLFHI